MTTKMEIYRNKFKMTIEIENQKFKMNSKWIQNDFNVDLKIQTAFRNSNKEWINQTWNEIWILTNKTSMEMEI